jgi:hypothetical protein
MALVDLSIARRAHGPQKGSYHLTLCFGHKGTLWLMVSVIARRLICQVLAHAWNPAQQARPCEFIIAMDDAHRVAVGRLIGTHGEPGVSWFGQVDNYRFLHSLAKRVLES